MTFPAVPLSGGETRTWPDEEAGLLVAEALGEIPVQAEREYLREHIVLGYN